MIASRSLKLLFALVTLSFSVLNAQEGELGARFEFLPSGLHFAPLKANHQEARVAVFKYYGSADLKVDIGNTIDLFAFSSSRVRWTVGIDFMAYAFVTGSQGLRLQVDALDGFFGGNLTISRQYPSNRLFGRFRVLHLSAHLVDGHYSVSQRMWLDNREPIPFTKDFGEFLLAHELQSRLLHLRYYGGASYATLVRPAHLKRFAFSAGLEFSILLGEVFEQPVYPFIANHFSLTGNPAYRGNNQTQIGVKFGTWHGKGVVLYLAYHRGDSFFSEYFDERVAIAGAGFAVDFP